LLVDRFSGHLTSEVESYLNAHGVQPCVVKHTPQGNPNDTIFNKEAKAATNKALSWFKGQRRAQSKTLERQGHPPLPMMTPEESRMLVLHTIRHLM
jgi:hypothetical protein